MTNEKKPVKKTAPKKVSAKKAAPKKAAPKKNTAKKASPKKAAAFEPHTHTEPPLSAGEQFLITGNGVVWPHGPKPSEPTPPKQGLGKRILQFFYRSTRPLK